MIVDRSEFSGVLAWFVIRRSLDARLFSQVGQVVPDTSVVCKCGRSVCVTTSLCGQDVGSVAWTTAGTQGSVTQENQDTLNLSLHHNPHNENYTSPLSLSLRSSLITPSTAMSLSLYLSVCLFFCPHLPCVFPFSSFSSVTLFFPSG